MTALAATVPQPVVYTTALQRPHLLSSLFLEMKASLYRAGEGRGRGRGRGAGWARGPLRPGVARTWLTRRWLQVCLVISPPESPGGC